MLTWALMPARRVAFVLALVLISGFLWALSSQSSSTGHIIRHFAVNGPAWDESTKIDLPQQTKVIGLVFFGRLEFVQILECYLQRNLKSNGGLLDQVIFVVTKADAQSTDYLASLVAKNPDYSSVYAGNENEMYDASWKPLEQHPDSIVVKIDDDVVFIDDNTIPSIVKRLVENPSYFGVSANLVNSPTMSWVHRAMGAYKPYFPEMEPPKDGVNALPSWRASKLPSYSGPSTGPDGFLLDGSSPAPFRNHRWLPVRGENASLADIPLNTPARHLDYSPFGPGLTNWAATAQTHYSFLENLETGSTWRYRFNMWDYHYERISINFIAFRARDVLDSFPMKNDDELYLTTERTKKLGRHIVVDGNALAVHFAFKPQYSSHNGHSVLWTDALARYQSYANEMVCPFPQRSAQHRVP